VKTGLHRQITSILRQPTMLIAALLLLSSCKGGGPSASGGGTDAGSSQIPITSPAPIPTTAPGIPTPAPTRIPSPPTATPAPTQPPAAATGRRMEILVGDGQAMMTFWNFGRPFVVKVTDTNGRPVANTPVRFETVDNPGAIAYRTNEVNTNADGIASLEVRSGSLNAQMNGFAKTRAFLPEVQPAVEVNFHTLCTPQIQKLPKSSTGLTTLNGGRLYSRSRCKFCSAAHAFSSGVPYFGSTSGSAAMDKLEISKIGSSHFILGLQVVFILVVPS
jgi:hypothetical protein